MNANVRITKKERNYLRRRSEEDSKWVEGEKAFINSEAYNIILSIQHDKTITEDLKKVVKYLKDLNGQ